MTLSEVAAVKVLFLNRHEGDQTSEVQLNFSFTDRSDSVSKCQLVLSLLIPFSCIGARRHRVWSRASIHEGSAFLARKKTTTNFNQEYTIYCYIVAANTR